MAAEALVLLRERAGALKGVVRVHLLGDSAQPVDREEVDGLADAPGAAVRPAAVVGGAHDLNGEPSVGLDRVRKLVAGRRGAVGSGQQASA